MKIEQESATTSTPRRMNIENLVVTSLETVWSWYYYRFSPAFYSDKTECSDKLLIIYNLMLVVTDETSDSRSDDPVEKSCECKNAFGRIVTTKYTKKCTSIVDDKTDRQRTNGPQQSDVITVPVGTQLNMLHATVMLCSQRGHSRTA